MSHHPLVRDSITLVRRNKDEEATLVSYIVPEFNKWPGWLAEKGLQDSLQDDSMVGMLRRFRPLYNDLRIHLKGKLASYAIPTHFIPLKKLPLNPNGKVDKPALPFPDVADLTAAEPEELNKAWNSLSDTERAVASIWGDLISNCKATTIRLDDSFFDLGGHSLLAQRMLLMLKRRLDGIQLPMALLFRDPTLQGFAASIDHIRKPVIVQLGSDGQPHQTDRQTNGLVQKDDGYADDARRLVKKLPQIFPSSERLELTDRPFTVFLTGASGFLGAYLLRELLGRRSPPVKVIAHVRAQSKEAGFERLEMSCKAYGIWADEWRDTLSCITGNLGDPRLGLDEEAWINIAETADVVLHNGAQVHWVYPYSKLRPVNVGGTMDALKLCCQGKPKHFVFVSSTSVLDTDYYVRLSTESLQAGGKGIPDEDDLAGSSTGLGTGYGQSKWVGEYLVKEAGRRGLRGTIVRPGYILGDSISGGMNP